MNDDRTTKKTIALDFDGVIHDYSGGWGDGEIRGEPTPRAFEVIRALLERRYSVFIHSARKPSQIRKWLLLREPFKAGSENRIPIECIAGDRRFWDVPMILGITDRKVPASVYVDDRAHRFDTSVKPAEHLWQELLEIYL
jgi:hypothetical protein